jgi:hypothetical protein
MGKFAPDPDEQVFIDRRMYTLQGGKVKFPVDSRCVLTNRRFVYHSLGKMAPFYFQLGFLLKLLVHGKPESIPLESLSLSRGSYAMNKKLLLISSDDGSELLMDNFDKSLEWISSTLNENGMSLVQTGEDHWRVNL